MSRGIFHLRHIGKFGNRIFSYCFARGYCQMHDLELVTDAWIGEEVFEISHARPSTTPLKVDENTLVFGDHNVSYRSYSQRQKCADYYTLDDIRRWLVFRPEIVNALKHLIPTGPLAHLRRGDYAGYGYPLVSKASYLNAAEKVGLDPNTLEFVSEESPFVHPSFTGELSMVPDFYRLATASIIFRANSTFSFWAAAIAKANNNNAVVFSPVIDGLKGGIEHNCEFVSGNCARFANLDFVEPITIKPSRPYDDFH